MRTRHIAVAGLWLGVLALTASSPSAVPQTANRVDYSRDVLPILRQNCYSCHGPKEQRNGFRLDRRKDALRGGTIVVIAPGSSDSSRLYHKLIGGQYGPQMPPAGPLPQSDIDTLKRWIDQGVDWPDALAGDAPIAPPDPAATKALEALRGGDRAAFTAMVTADPKVASRKGFGGSTPLMYAVLYGDAALVESLLDKGADANVRNEAGATALMWATPSLEKVRLLVEHGADVNARSDDGRTPLLIASGQFGGTPIVQFLLDKGAVVDVKSPGIVGAVTPLLEAARLGDEGLMRLLIQHGADPAAVGPGGVVFAARTRCEACVNLLIPGLDPMGVAIASFMFSPPLGTSATRIPMLLDRGMDARAVAPNGFSLLHLAASSDAMPVDTIQTLLAKGADVNAKGPDGETALQLAERNGQTPVVDLLKKAGGTSGGTKPAIPAAKPAATPRAALERSLPLLQHTDATFLQKAGCISCHNNTMTATTVAAARASGVAVDMKAADANTKKVAEYLEAWRDRVLQGVGIPGDSETVAALLIDLNAGHHPADHATDAMVRFLRLQQWPDGHWKPLAHRPPIEGTDIQVTASAMRAIQLYTPAVQRAESDAAVKRAAAWLAAAKPSDTQDRAVQLMGLAWSGASPAAIAASVKALRADQRPDGGWSQLPTLASDSYATGQALVALGEAGGVASSDPAFAKGVKFLMDTQRADGSWYVPTRVIPLQPYFDSGFPYGHDQWISAAGTNWAATALARVK